MKFIKYQERRNKGRLITRYKVYNFGLLKIKKKILPVWGENNRIIIGGRELNENEKKLLDKFGKITIEGNNNIVELPDISNLSCDICIKGNCNEISIGGEQIKVVGKKNDVENVTIIIEGNNNITKLAEINYLLYNGWVQGNDNKICIGKFNQTTNIGIWAKYNCNSSELIIEDSKFIAGCNFLLAGNNRKIHIGKNCMFSVGIYIWNTDAHPIYDLETHERINEEKDVMIGDDVWIGRDVYILKNSVIPSGCVIGVRAVVNKTFTKENCIIAGSPAKVVKENICWDSVLKN